MNILTAEQITKSYTERKLVDHISFSMQEGEKVGVIGINGTGKSTLLKILAGLEEPDEGQVILANHVIVRYLPQNPTFHSGTKVLDCVLNHREAHEDSWDKEGEAKTMLTRLGITDFEQNVDELSGGQRKRLALAAVLLSPADILILDEPTNHLDNEMADWLENFLKSWRGALIMVTHDRYFLDSVSNRIVEIDKGGLYSYQANYSGYLALKAEREEMAMATERKRQSLLRTELEWMQRGARARSTKQKAHIQRYENLKNQSAPVQDSKVEISSVSSRLGRTTVELSHLSKRYGEKVLFEDFSYIFLKQDRIGFIGTNGCGKTTLMKIIAGLDRPDEGAVEIGQTVKIGYYAQEIAETEAGKRVGVGRANTGSVDAGRANAGSVDAGRANAGSVDADRANAGSVDAGRADGAEYEARMRSVKDVSTMDPSMRVIDYIKDTAEYVRTEDGLVSASKMLERFLFTSDMQYSPIGKLSGGEKRRLNLLRVLMEAPNVLILDEPTNDLDIATMTLLEDYLDHYDGIVITVSHDRYFLDRIVRRIFAFENGTLRQYEGGYTDYAQRKEWEEWQAAEALNAGRSGGRGNTAASRKGGSQETAEGNDGAASQEAAFSKNGKPRGPRKLRFTWQEQKDYETIEEEIADLEEKIESLEGAMNGAASDFVKLNQLAQEKEAAEQALEEKMDRWMYLEDLAQKIAEQE